MTRVACIAILALVSTAAHAAPPSASVPQSRTYVSSAGVDSGSCVPTSPCRTLQYALGMTLAKGEIYVLDSGYYGALTINKAVAITSEGAVAGTAGITIAAGANDDVLLRGLELDGAFASATGVQFTSGRSLIISKSAVRNFTNTGVAASAGAVFLDSVQVSSNGNNGIAISGSAVAVLSKVTAILNGSTGVFASGANVAVTDSVVTGNNFGIAATGGAVMVRNTLAINNAAAGLRADAGTVRVIGSRIDGAQAINGGAIVSFGNNAFTGGTPTQTVPLL